MKYCVTIYYANQLDAEKAGVFFTNNVSEICRLLSTLDAMNRYLTNPLMMVIEPVIEEEKEIEK